MLVSFLGQKGLNNVKVTTRLSTLNFSLQYINVHKITSKLVFSSNWMVTGRGNALNHNFNKL